MTYRSTKAQWGYFRKLTGDSLPSGCSKSEASRLIKQALAGKYVKKRTTVRVFGLCFTGAMEIANGTSRIRYTVEADYTPGPQFDTFAEAEACARARYENDPNVDLSIEPNTVRQLLVD